MQKKRVHGYSGSGFDRNSGLQPIKKNYVAEANITIFGFDTLFFGKQSLSYYALNMAKKTPHSKSEGMPWLKKINKRMQNNKKENLQ